MIWKRELVIFLHPPLFLYSHFLDSRKLSKVIIPQYKYFLHVQFRLLILTMTLHHMFWITNILFALWMVRDKESSFNIVSLPLSVHWWQWICILIRRNISWVWGCWVNNLLLRTFNSDLQGCFCHGISSVQSILGANLNSHPPVAPWDYH